MGPTAAGKTDIAIDWVAKYPCDIISVDSALVYRGMDIGTAKPSAAILQKAPHRLIDILEPTQRYSAADFCADAIREIENIIAEQRIPLLVGGTMLYYHALQRGLAVLPPANLEIRKQLNNEMKQLGVAALYQRLAEIDRDAAQRIKPTDWQRVQRALEVYLLTGKTLSALQQHTVPLTNYEFINIAVIPAIRQQLHQRIATRFHNMLAEGLIEEIENLKTRYTLSLDLPAMRAVGYRQVWEYLDGAYSKEVMIEKGIAATRQLAKRQLTWLRSWPEIRFYPLNPVKLFK